MIDIGSPSHHRMPESRYSYLLQLSSYTICHFYSILHISICIDYMKLEKKWPDTSTLYLGEEKTRLSGVRLYNGVLYKIEWVNLVWVNPL